MRNLQIRLIDMKIIVKKNVDVDYPVAIMSVNAFTRSANGLFNVLRYTEQVSWGKTCLTSHARVDKIVW